MKKIILYRFHEGVGFHQERVAILRHFNPETPIHAIAGGVQNKESADALRPIFDSYCEHPSSNGEWRWRSGDLIVRDWYKMVGHRYNFQHVYDCEWDVLMTDKLENIFPAIEKSDVALTRLLPLAMYDHAWHWTASPHYREKMVTFCRYMSLKYGMGYPKYFCFWPGAVLSRNFLEDLVAMDLEDSLMLCSELTTPAIAEMLGYHLIDNQVMPNVSAHFNDALISPFFHPDANFPVSQELILAELRRSQGRPRRQIFHPVKRSIALQDILIAKKRGLSCVGRGPIKSARSVGENRNFNA